MALLLFRFIIFWASKTFWPQYLSTSLLILRRATETFLFLLYLIVVNAILFPSSGPCNNLRQFKLMYSRYCFYLFFLSLPYLVIVRMMTNDTLFENPGWSVNLLTSKQGNFLAASDSQQSDVMPIHSLMSVVLYTCMTVAFLSTSLECASWHYFLVVRTKSIHR